MNNKNQRSKFHSVLESDGFLLTNIEWFGEYSSSFGSCETGVRSIKDDGTYDNFQLIQHGWRDFNKANYIILNGLKKDWGLGRISALMDFIKERKQI